MKKCHSPFRYTSVLLFVFFISVSFPAVISAQDFQVPMGYRFERESDYKRYEADVIACVNWLENTPLSKENKDKRMSASAFLLQYITGSPQVMIELNSEFTFYSKKNADLLFLFMGAWTRYSLQNSYDNDVEKGTIAGMTSVVKFYKAGNGCKKDKKMDEMVVLYDEGKLEEWIKEKLNKSK